MNSGKLHIVKVIGIGLAVLGAPRLTAAAYNESVDGDLSGNYLSPTTVAVVANGSTSITGTIAGAGNGVSTDLDYFKVTVPPGQTLAALLVRSGTTTGGTGSFIGVYDGAAGTNPATATGAQLRGYYLYKVADINTDILDDMGTFNFNGTNPSQGFTPPLPAGDYTFWIQEGANGTFNYNMELQLVPEPAGWLLGLAGLAMMGRRGKKRGEKRVARIVEREERRGVFRMPTRSSLLASPLKPFAISCVRRESLWLEICP